MLQTHVSLGSYEDLSLEERVGQLLHVGFFGTEPSAEIRRLLAERHVGGVIIFARNLKGAEHVTELTAALQSHARRPLLLSADQEGGSVLRVREGASLLPSAMGAGRLGVEAVAELAAICGREMRAMGLNLNLAPVLDVNNPANPGVGIRSYGEDAHEVAARGEAYVRALQAEGVLACAKHYPGKGAARLDAHHDLPVIDRTLAQLEEHELVPFRAAMRAGVAATLTSHCLYPAIDDQPATLSHAILTGLLRERMGFDGIVITDDMEMGAITRYQPWPEAAVAAFAAGADQILVCHDHRKQESAIDAIVAALREGRVPMERLEASMQRIWRAKGRLAEPTRGELAALVARHEPIVQAFCDRIVEVVRDPGQLPLSGQALDVYWPKLGVLTMVEEGTAGEELIREAITRRIPDVRWHAYDPKEPGEVPLPGDRRSLFFSANAHLYGPQAELLARVKPSVLVALRNPYDEALAGPETAVVTTYGFLPNALAALAKVL